MSFQNTKGFTAKTSLKEMPSGFTLIELMIVVAIIAIILTVALPIYSEYTTRTKVGEALSIAAAAITSVTESCNDDPTIATITEENMGYQFASSTYVATVSLSGPCTQPVISVQTQQTGASPDPVITLTGNLDSGRMSFTCVSSGSARHVPRECRS